MMSASDLAFSNASVLGTHLQDQYIVSLRSDVDANDFARELRGRGNADVRAVFQHALNGLSVRGNLQALLADPRVSAVEPDQVLRILAQTTPTGVDRVDADVNPVAHINGVDERIDVDIAVLDTGASSTHPDLNIYQAQNFVTATDGVRNPALWEDGHGHGSHVAGIAAAIDNGQGVVGMAPGARLWIAKVVDDTGYGTMTDVLAAIDWVTLNSGEIDVVNMSLGETGRSNAFRTAIQASVAKGIVYAVAAGNDGRDIFGADGVFNAEGVNDDFMPAAYPEVLTVSAFNDYDGVPGGNGGSFWDRLLYGNDDQFANYSNYSASAAPGNPVSSPGGGIDLVMPGTRIYSADKNGGYTTKDGTSMASPHAAGLVGLYIAEFGRDVNGDGLKNEADVYAIRQALINRGVAQNAANGLKNGGDRDALAERVGWAGAVFTRTPTASDDNATTEPASLVIDVLANDVDPDGDRLRVNIKSQPAGGRVTVNADQTVTYTPNAGFTGSDSFNYAAHDGTFESSVVIVSITVTSPSPISAGNDSYSTSEDSALTVNAPGILSNDSHLGGQSLTAVLVAGPQHGTLELHSDGSFVYSPAENFAGADSFTYQAYDGEIYSNNATVSLSVTNVNDAPVATSDSYAVEQESTLTVNAPGVLSNDSDPDGNVLSARLVSGGGPFHGTVTLNADGSFTYTPAAGYYGPDTFSYVANDGQQDSPAATVTIDVLQVTPGAVTTYTNGTVVNIVDRGTIESTISVADSYTISDLNVELWISHTYDADLDVFLIAPDGTHIELFTDVGGRGDNFNGTLLDAEASVSITSGTAPFSGTYRPEGNLAALYNKSVTGTWTLRVTDDARKNTGTLKSWSLVVTAPDSVVSGGTLQATSHNGSLQSDSLQSAVALLPARSADSQLTVESTGPQPVVVREKKFAEPDAFLISSPIVALSAASHVDPVAVVDQVFTELNDKLLDDDEWLKVELS